MALIIKGDMPASCRWHNKQGKNTPIEVCPYFQNCSAEFNFEDYRPSDCPILGEIPDKHGRLVEIDKLIEVFNQKISSEGQLTVSDVLSILDDAPAIVEATR